MVFSFLVVFSSIVFGQSGFNPPKSTINEPLKVENVGLDTVFLQMIVCEFLALLKDLEIILELEKQINEKSNRKK